MGLNFNEVMKAQILFNLNALNSAQSDKEKADIIHMIIYLINYGISKGFITDAESIYFTELPKEKGIDTWK